MSNPLRLLEVTRAGPISGCSPKMLARLMPPAIGDGEQTSRRRGLDESQWATWTLKSILNKLEQIINQFYVVTCYTILYYIYLCPLYVTSASSMIVSSFSVRCLITTEVTVLLKLRHGSTWMVLSQNAVQTQRWHREKLLSRSSAVCWWLLVEIEGHLGHSFNLYLPFAIHI